MTVHVLHENPDWFPPFAAAFAAEGVAYEEHLLDTGTLDLDAAPPPGVWWSRMSASAHTRGHGGAKDHTRAVLSWLEAYGRRVVNGRRVLELEMSKVDQLTALKATGIDVPRTIAVAGSEGLAAAARRLPAPFIAKHNQGGKGLGVRRWDSHGEYEDWLASSSAHDYAGDRLRDAHGYAGDRLRDEEPPVDGITLLQEYVAPAEPYVTRVEIVAGELLYALRADTRSGFQLCPADACAVDSAPLFTLVKDFESPLVAQYLSFARQVGLEVAGLEFIETAEGRCVTYDVNTNTNYNPEVEAQAERSGPVQIARFLGSLEA